MNEELRRIVEQVEQLDPVLQEAIVHEFQRVVTVVANASPSDLLPWDEQFARFTLRARTILHLAREEAQRLQHPAVGPEHLLLGLVRDGEGVAGRVLQQLGIADLDRVRATVEFITGRGGPPVAGDLPWSAKAEAVFALAAGEARDLGAGHCGTEHLLLGLLRQGDSVATQTLLMLGMDLGKARQQTLRAIGKGI